MPADVIEVDFEARRRERMSPGELVDEVAAAVDETGSIVTAAVQLGKQLVDRLAWVENQWDLSRRGANRLHRSLVRERARNFPFSDEEVLDALRTVYEGAPVSAATIAEALYGDREPTHSACVRVGLALHRLRDTGRAEAAVPPSRSVATRWAPAKRGGRDDG